MIRTRDELKTRYSFSDFLFYFCLLSVPIVTAIVAILKNSIWWTIAFVVICVAITGLVLKFYCTHCPHYTREDKRLKCIFFWGFPKIFHTRPERLNVADKVVAFIAIAVLLLFPLYWLLLEFDLLIIYVLSLTVCFAAIYRSECKRCIYFECPLNRVPEVIRNP